MAIESIAKTLGTGSGIDITSLVSQLVDAQFANKNAQLTKKSDALEAQISSVSEIRNGITGFAGALSSLTKGGTLATQPTSSNTGIVAATALSGASLKGLSAQVEVRQLASAQVSSSAPVADKAAAIGTGTLTIRFGTATITDGAMDSFTAGSGNAVSVAVTAGKSSLTEIAASINAANAGVTATILTDSDGSRLVLKGASGAARAFTMSVAEDAGAPGLSALAVGVGAAGSTIGAAAQDAIVAVDGVAVKRTSNSVSDVIAGVRLDLVSASVGTKVTIGSKPPLDALGQTVSDVVETYNTLYAMLKTATDAVDGPLRADPAAKALLRSLAGLTLAPLVEGAPAGAPTTLSAIGVATNRDGTLSLDSASLSLALLRNPDAVEAMFAPGKGLTKALDAISTAATSKSFGLGASETRYTTAKADLADDQADALAKAEALRTRMTQQFASMDAKVAAYKSTQTFLEQQVDAWNASKQ